MNKITTLVVVIIGLLILVTYFITANLSNQPKFTSISSSDSPTLPVKASLHPLAIDSLRTRQFSPQTLTIEREVTVNSQVVSYSSDSFKLYALMITPKGEVPSGGWPVIIVNHGYIPPNQYSVTRSYINTSNYFASQGFLVLKPDYRGHDNSEGQASNRLFARSLYTIDVLNLLSTIDSISVANPNKIFMYGHSMGGEVTLQVLETSAKITAATLWAPSVTSLPEQAIHFLNKTRPNLAEIADFQSQYEEFSKSYSSSQITSIDHLSQIVAPINLHHATADESVPYDWGATLVQKLKSANKIVNFYSYPGDNHDIAGNFGRALSRDVAFFKSFL